MLGENESCRWNVHDSAHSLLVSIVRVAKEINNLEKNAEEFGGEGEKREERLNIWGFSFLRPPSKRRKETLGEKKSAGTAFHRMPFIPCSTNIRPNL